MNIVLESLRGTHITTYGPFPTQDAAFDFRDELKESRDQLPHGAQFSFLVTGLIEPQNGLALAASSARKVKS